MPNAQPDAASSAEPDTGPVPIDPLDGPARRLSRRELRRLGVHRFAPWRGLLCWALVAAAVQLAAIAGFSPPHPGRHQTAAAAALLAASASVLGVLVGLLFGVPHRPLPRPADQPGAAPEPTRTALEQVSDWLGKILIGIALTRFTTIVGWAGRLFDRLGSMLGPDRTAVLFAGALVVFGLGSGFLTGWLFGRLLLGAPIGEADHRVTTLTLLDAAERVERTGDADAAGRLRAHAKDLLAGSTGTLPILPARDVTSGPPRDPQLEELMAQARTTARSLTLDPDDVAALLRDGGDGQRATALAFMQAKQELTDVDALATVLTQPRTAFEQHQALALAVQVRPYLSVPDAERLRDAAQHSTLDVGLDTSRIALRSQLLA